MRGGSLPTLTVIGVYSEVPDYRHENLQVKFWDSVTVARLFMLVVDYKKGIITSPFIELTLTDEDKEKLKSQGIEIERLSRLIFDIRKAKTC